MTHKEAEKLISIKICYWFTCNGSLKRDKQYISDLSGDQDQYTQVNIAVCCPEYTDADMWTETYVDIEIEQWGYVRAA